MKFLANEPALLVGKTLIIADLHIGIENIFRQSRIKVGSQTNRMIKRLENLLKSTRAERLIILGDIKHKVPGISWQEIKEVPKFLKYFQKLVDIELVTGNHDSNLKDILEDVKIYPSSGFLLKTGPHVLYLMHGNAYPSKDIFKAKQVISAHIHPEFNFKNKMGYRWKEQVWLKTKLNIKKLSEKIKVKTNVKQLDLIIMPAFNPLAGGGVNWHFDIKSKSRKKMQCLISHYNEKKRGSIMNYVDLKNTEIYLLDGIFLGKLKNIKK